MDQREIVSLLKKHYFWGVNVLIVLVALACWWLATSAVNKRYVTRKAEIDKHKKAMESLKNAPNPPNDRVVKAIDDDKIAKINENVAAAWDTLYKDQQKNNLYPEILGKDFKDAFEKRDASGELSDLNDGLRQNFGNRVRDHWRKPFAQIGIPFPEKEKTATNTRPGERQPAEAQGIVDWDSGDAGRFIARFDWTGVPSTSQVRLAMEDLWVYEALLRVIEKTNTDADGNKVSNRYFAAVKRIEALDIGPEFFTPSKRVSAPAPGRRPDGPSRGPAVEGGPMVRGGPPPGAVRSMPTTPHASPESSPTAAAGDMPDNRYVNAKFEGLKSADKPPYEEFRMMPVRMRLLIDQRKLPKLLVECANSSMPIEVRKLSILPRGDAPTSRQAGGAGTPSAPPAHEMGVELEGRIYIFNPPKVKANTAADAAKKPDGEATDDAAKPEAGKTETGKTEADKTEAEAKPAAANGKTEATGKTDAADDKPDSAAPKPE
jgi:hypothetical protein